MYRGRLERDLTLWVHKGMLDATSAEALLAEYDSRPASFSLSRVLMVLAALLVATAILLLVASNWEAIPRLVRVAGIIALIWAFYLAAAVFLRRNQFAVATAFLVLGTLSFGAAISLVAQMYHMTGDELTMMIVWFAIAVLAALLFRSDALTVLAGFLSWATFVVYLERYDIRWVGLGPWAAPLMAGVVLLLLRYTGAARARHLAYLLLIGWLTWLYSLHEDTRIAAAFFVVGMLVFIAVSLPVPTVRRFMQDVGPAPAFYAFLLSAIGLFLLHTQIDEGWRLIVLAIAALAAAVLAIALQGKHNGAVRYLAYAVFAAEILYLASVTIGSILGTSGFFLCAGLFVALVAWVVVRMERRFSLRREEAGA